MSVNEPLFEETLSGLEAGLQVRLIAVSSLETCTVSDDAENVLAKFSDFTCIPVRQNGEIIGVLERSRTPAQGPVEQCMRRLVGSMLISAGASLAELISHLEQSTYRLVVTEGGITGIVTRSDLQKLPVRLYAFALITHLETVMAQIIWRKTANDDQAWIKLLKPKRIEKIEEKRKELRSEDSDLPLLELTEFCDKREILANLLRPSLSVSRRAFEKDLEAIEKLRNSLDHAGSYADDGLRGQEFIVRLEKARHWIDTLSHYLKEQPSTEETISMPQPASITTKE